MSYKTIADRTHKCPDILENGVYFIIRTGKNLHPTSDVIIFEILVFTRPQDYVKFPFPKTHSLKSVLKNLRFCVWKRCIRVDGRKKWSKRISIFENIWIPFDEVSVSAGQRGVHFVSCI